mmetsp:Transcript_18949/g.34095  ORF Transcript_18949/g.34095 Transcript_18949/m.34095 type:complete len:717 (+) Transcript_18949:92-2242(+)|eukprot:CAMPEP_0196135734 /NCGR_PEP_ID=MMETSP0910-20130528/4279_1 /TAXON_ID=49265 /ORGANISM="Thalassiosira rotula, Strain GSO102" /LENGTH=716 /DNA_ID=CAMNT_0041395921 /DNA_START=141 /DNA_END=2291 /DNA_ORIENTATION=+
MTPRDVIPEVETKNVELPSTSSSNDDDDDGNEQHDDNNNNNNNHNNNSRIKNPRRPLKILFLSADTGGGHRASAEALAIQFQNLHPHTTYDLFDIWSDTQTYWPYNTLTETYTSASATPWKWRALYYVTNKELNQKFYNAHSCLMNEGLVRRRMVELGLDTPDCVVSVHPTMNYLPLRSIRKISEELDRHIPFFTVVTDFGSGHLTWFNKDVDKLYLASEPIKQIAQKRGNVPDTKISMIGLPIRYDFALQSDAMGTGGRTSPKGKAHQQKIRNQFNIDTNKQMILVMGGGEGVGSLSKIVDELYARLYIRGMDATICVVCGRNTTLRSKLERTNWEKVAINTLQPSGMQHAMNRAACRVPVNNIDDVDILGNITVLPLGFVNQMAEYMVMADVLLTKAGPGSIAEAAAVGLPVMITSHLPGQEAGNVDIVLNGKFGGYCEHPKTIAKTIVAWLNDTEKLEEMSRRARMAGHPHAAEEIAEDIGRLTCEWMERNEVRQLKKKLEEEEQFKNSGPSGEVGTRNESKPDPSTEKNVATDEISSEVNASSTIGGWALSQLRFKAAGRYESKNSNPSVEESVPNTKSSEAMAQDETKPDPSAGENETDDNSPEVSASSTVGGWALSQFKFKTVDRNESKNSDPSAEESLPNENSLEVRAQDEMKSDPSEEKRVPDEISSDVSTPSTIRGWALSQFKLTVPRHQAASWTVSQPPPEKVVTA